MEKYWLEIRQKVVDLGKLLQRVDRDNKLVWGSHSHRFNIYPTVNEEDIRIFEAKHDTQLPKNYQTYLRYFGAGGAGPEIGIDRFPDHVSAGNLSKPLDLNFYPELDFSNGYSETENVNGPLFDLDGMLRIGSAGQAQYYLVVSGALAGNVICWDREWGMGCLSGPFDIWYRRWVECIYLGLSEYEALKTLKVGMRLNEILSNPSLNIQYRKNNENVLDFKFNLWWIEIDSNKLISRISHRDYSVGQSGFNCWSDSKGKYLG